MRFACVDADAEVAAAAAGGCVCFDLGDVITAGN
jgi:hypothetical protein